MAAVRGRRGETRSRLATLLADRRGLAAMELAIVCAILVPAVLAVVDIGNAAQQQIELQQALHAGGQYAMSFPTDTTGITSAITNALPSNWVSGSTKNITLATPTASCTCWTSGSTSNCAGSGAPCTSGQTVERFMTLTASSTYTGSFISPTISASYVARYQ